MYAIEISLATHQKYKYNEILYFMKKFIFLFIPLLSISFIANGETLSEFSEKNTPEQRRLEYLKRIQGLASEKSTQFKNPQSATEAFVSKPKSTIEIIESIVGKEPEAPKNTSSNTNDFSNPLNINPSLNYAQRIIRRIQPNIIFSGDPPINTSSCEIEIKVKPDGEIYSRKIIKSSGHQLWDTAVIRAIDRTERIPLDADGKVPPILIISFKP